MSNDPGSQHPSDPGLDDIARSFVEARREGRSLPDFPGTIPDDLVTAYHVQDLAIGRWDDQVVGWKVGYIAAERRDVSGDERLLGPIFQRNLWNATGAIVDIPVFSGAGGFAAVEAEYVLQLDAEEAQLVHDLQPLASATIQATRRFCSGVTIQVGNKVQEFLEDQIGGKAAVEDGQIVIR